MKQQWKKIAARFDALAVRERVLVAVATVVGAILVFDALALEPLAARKKRLTQQFTEARQALKIAESVMKTPMASDDPNAVKRPYRDALRKQLAEIDQNMQGLQRGLVPPERMAKLLEEMLARSRLQLVSLRTLPVQRFESPGAPPALKAAGKTGRMPGEPERTLYQHSFEIILQGSYTDLHNYLTRLEKLPWQMFWGRISVNTERYPRLRVTLTVQTMSLNKAWLIV